MEQLGEEGKLVEAAHLQQQHAQEGAQGQAQVRWRRSQHGVCCHDEGGCEEHVSQSMQMGIMKGQWCVMVVGQRTLAGDQHEVHDGHCGL